MFSEILIKLTERKTKLDRFPANPSIIMIMFLKLEATAFLKDLT